RSHPFRGCVVLAPLAYLLSWTTYGTWLPGDERGWVEGGVPGIQPDNPARRDTARGRMKEAPVTLTAAQREGVEATVRDHCTFRGWPLHAVNARSNHVHVVLTAPEVAPEEVMALLKAWCSRRLNEQVGRRGALVDAPRRYEVDQRRGVFRERSPLRPRT